MKDRTSTDHKTQAADATAMAFAERLIIAVERAGGATAMSKQAGVSSSVLRKWRTGQSEPNRKHLLQLAEAAQVSVGWLAAGEGRMELNSWPRIAEKGSVYTLQSTDAIDHLPVEVYAKMVKPLHDLGKTPEERQAILTATLRLLGLLKMAGTIDIDHLDEADILPIIQVALLTNATSEDA
ncbi:helix-turn-helix domain-containing protein [Saccharospirillum mangrovi]|uniref:helix-turn-helix domain-containing protein n=1 Tax=Saccharospirillum mangrovi TaxID=2161747 RepID=UPI000D3A1A7F|nr:helix-turn-helix domain-containing protein [Saccharospirillum mangrovi]